MTATINAATIYAAAIAAADTIKAAAAAAGWGYYSDQQTPSAIHKGMIDDAKRLVSSTPYGYEMEYAQALEIEPDQNAPHWLRAFSYTHEETYKAMADSVRAAALSELLEHITAPSAPEFLTIKTSEKGAMRIKNCAKNLESFAAKVKSNAKAFGGGFTRATNASKGAQTYSTQAIKVWRERLQERDYAGALELADDKLAPLFFIGNKGVPFMMVAPVDVDGWPDLCSAMHEDGKFNIQERHAGRAISADYKAGTRAKSSELAMATWREASEEKRANAMQRARADAVSQEKARAAWCELRGLETTATSEDTTQDQAAAMAQNQAHACEQLAEIVATATAAAAIATAQETSAAHQADTSEARELETCGAATSEATSAGAATYGHASTTSAPAPARAPVTLDNGRVVVCKRAPNGSQDAFMQDGAPMSGAEWTEFCARIAGNHQDQARAKRRTIDNSKDDGAHWTATLRTSAAGAYSLRFMGDGGAWEPVTEHATRRERAQALRVLIQKNADNAAGFDDTPEDQDQAAPELDTDAPADQADQPSADQGIDTPAQADRPPQGMGGADYTDQRKTSQPAADYTTPRETSEETSAPENDQAAPDFVGSATYSPQDNKLRLTPFARLDRAIYDQLKAAGFTWAPKQGVFVASMWTPGREDLLQRLDDGAAVLEPSAGTGMLLAAIRSAAPGAQRTAVEINQTLCTILRAQDKAAQVVAGDFLEWTAPALFDAVVMNPPFKDAADIGHILHALAMLKPGGRLVAICAGGPRQADKLGALVESMGGLWEPLPAGTFAQAGTQVNAVLLCITTPRQDQAAPELDTDAPADQAEQASAAQGIDTPAQADRIPQGIEGADYTDPRKTSALAADYTTPRKTLKIAEIRRVIDSCNWSRRDMGGATREEFKAMNVPARLNPHIDAVRALQIPARFTRDIENQASAIEYALKTIARWHAMQDQPPPPPQNVPDDAPDNAPPAPTTATTMTNTTTTDTERMTGAELQTLRESCNLSREDFAGLAGVQSRTVKHWESGRKGVPFDVASLVNTIDGAINAGADQVRAHLEQLTQHSDQAPADIVLIRYRSNEDLHRYRPDMQAMPACVHGAIVNRMRQEARAKGIPARVVWMEPEQYNPWRAACHLADTESTRAAWAAQQVEAQAMPHRGDQPPA